MGTLNLQPIKIHSCRVWCISSRVQPYITDSLDHVGPGHRTGLLRERLQRLHLVAASRASVSRWFTLCGPLNNYSAYIYGGPADIPTVSSFSFHSGRRKPREACTWFDAFGMLHWIINLHHNKIYSDQKEFYQVAHFPAFPSIWPSRHPSSPPSPWLVACSHRGDPRLGLTPRVVEGRGWKPWVWGGRWWSCVWGIDREVISCVTDITDLTVLSECVHSHHRKVPLRTETNIFLYAVKIRPKIFIWFIGLNPFNYNIKH